MNKEIILTGIRPTGPLHIGHLVGALRPNIEIQNAGGYERMYAMIADAQGLTDNFDNPQKIRENVLAITLDMLAAGYAPEKTTMFIQSEVSELAELTFYYMNLVSMARLSRNPTVKMEIGQKEKFRGGATVGFLTYPISQAADITAFGATVVPVGEDQRPMLEQAREIVDKFNAIYGDTLAMPRAVVPDAGTAARLPGTDGNAKMGKSLGNVINLSDGPDEIAARIKTMFTDPSHLRAEDPGHTENNPVFIYLSVFAKPETYLPLKEQYERGGLGDVKVKSVLNEIMQETLRPIRERRAELAKDPGEIMNILKSGTDVARAAAAETMTRVKKAMRLDYF